LKFDQDWEPVEKVDLEKLRRTMHIRPGQRVLLAGSTHKGEEEILVEAFAGMKREFPRLTLIIVPRDPRRAESVCRICRDGGLTALPLKELGSAEAETTAEVIIVDVIGLLRRLYGLADIAFVGGSLVKSGGHNPLEPAAFSRPILFGPDMSDFAQISEMLLQSEGALRVHNEESLRHASVLLLKDQKRSEDMGKRALHVFLANKGATQKTLKVIKSVRVPG
jgi:3-deoxy-D-manno-octulosonic-acid transferase